MARTMQNEILCTVNKRQFGHPETAALCEICSQEEPTLLIRKLIIQDKIRIIKKRCNDLQIKIAAMEILHNSLRDVPSARGIRDRGA
ncbi:Hypothetical protein CINCED_3A010150 [Cinara cedri]|uniref:Uncharacterized protein n=1 Tax=Cinara cedri TaxID=506608 RepID=A0A5E4N0W0_9HEMI|nr:Hypothetical protein CINCED_3A010150 [Cinara cedri]